MDIPAGILASPEKPFRICAIFQVADPTPTEISELKKVVEETIRLSQAVSSFSISRWLSYILGIPTLDWALPPLPHPSLQSSFKPS